MTHRQKIYLISPAHPLRGGIASSSERLAQELTVHGHDVVLISYSLQYPGFLFPGKTQYTKDPAPAGVRIRTLINAVNPLNWLRVGRILAREKPDLIIVRYWLPLMGPCLGTILRFVRLNGHTRIIALADNIIPHEKRPGDALFTRYFCGAADAFIAMSKTVATDIGLFAPGKPVEYIPHPLYDNYGDKVPREAALQQLQLDGDTRYLLFFGFIRDYKGLDLLLDAMAEPQLAEFNLKLIVAGEFYGNEAAYQQHIDRLGIRDKLILHTDFIPHEAVKYYFGAADLVVQPYKSATQSGISQLAYHFEKPMVVTRVGGLPEIVPHGEAGYVVAVDARDIAAAIADFYRNQRGDQLQAGVAKEKRRFSWENMAEGIYRLYVKLLAAKKR